MGFSFRRGELVPAAPGRGGKSDAETAAQAMEEQGQENVPPSPLIHVPADAVEPPSEEAPAAEHLAAQMPLDEFPADLPLPRIRVGRYDWHRRWANAQEKVFNTPRAAA